MSHGGCGNNLRCPALRKKGRAGLGWPPRGSACTVVEFARATGAAAPCSHVISPTLPNSPSLNAAKEHAMKPAFCPARGSKLLFASSFVNVFVNVFVNLLVSLLLLTGSVTSAQVASRR